MKRVPKEQLRQRIAAVLMILIQVVVLEYMLFGYEYFPLILAFIALLAAPGFFRVRLGRTAGGIAAALLAVFVWYGTQAFLFRGRLPVLPFLTGVSYPIGWYLLVLEVAMLFMQTPTGRLPVYFPALSAAVMAYAGLMPQRNSLDPVYHSASLMFIILAIVFWKSEKSPACQSVPSAVRWRGLLAQCGIVLLAFLIAVPTSVAVGVYRTGIDLAVFNLLGGMENKSSVGFSTKTRIGRIGAMSDEEGEKVALRIESARVPGYMRGRAYDQYQDGQWLVTVKEKPLPELTERRPGVSKDPDITVFQMREGQPPYQPMEIVPAADFEGCLFAPLEACFIALINDSPTCDNVGNLRVSGTGAGNQYEAYAASEVKENLPERLREKTMALPQLDAGIRDLAAQLYRDQTTTSQKIAATIAYFKNNYRYNLGIEIPEGKDPLAYFLLEQPPAHCEYFATGAAVLLRLGGVPARYVTGFVAAEHNAIGGYWLARNKDAHAWVEAWDDAARAWVLVEATVAEGLPGAHKHEAPGVLGQLKDYAGYLRQRLRAFIMAGGWQRMLRQTRPATWIWVPAALVALIATFRYATRKRIKAARKRPVQSLESKDLLRLRRTVDKKVRRYGFVRAPEETILSFANRLASADQPDPAPLRRVAQWYRLYNEARFGCVVSRDQVERLKAALPQ